MNTEKKIQTGIDFMTENYPNGIEYKVELHQIKDWRGRIIETRKIVTVVFMDYQNYSDCEAKRINGKVKLPDQQLKLYPQ